MGKKPATGWMTIEELSMRSGVTTRNIRSYQSRALLPPPVNRPQERAAFYTNDHLARLRLVNRLQKRGFSLAGIADLLSAWGEGKSIVGARSLSISVGLRLQRIRCGATGGPSAAP